MVAIDCWILSAGDGIGRIPTNPRLSLEAWSLGHHVARYHTTGLSALPFASKQMIAARQKKS